MSCYSCFSVLSNSSYKYVISFSSSTSIFFKEFSKSVILSWIFYESEVKFYLNVLSLTEILYSDFPNLNSGILQFDGEKFMSWFAALALKLILLKHSSEYWINIFQSLTNYTRSSTETLPKLATVV